MFPTTPSAIPDSGPTYPVSTRRSTLKFLLVFGGIWTTVVMIFNTVLITGALNSFAAASFPTTPGVILAADIESHMSSGKSPQRVYSAAVHYSYSVNGTSYTSDRIRYAAMSSSDSSHAQDDLARYPAGSPVTVRYNPKRPSDAVLEPGMSPDLRFMAIFLTPFNCIMLGCWTMLLASLRGRVDRPNISEDLLLRVRLTALPSIMWGIIAALIASIPLLFIFAFVANASATAFQLAFHQGLVLTVAAAVYLWHKRRVLAGHFDLVIDPVRRTLTLPRARIKDQGISLDVPFSRLTGLQILDSTTTRVGNQPVKDVLLLASSPAPARTKLRTFVEQADADAFCAWLRTRLGLPEPRPQTVADKHLDPAQPPPVPAS